MQRSSSGKSVVPNLHFDYLIISAAFTVRGILKCVILTFVLFSRVICSEWNGWTNFLNNNSLLGSIKIINKLGRSMTKGEWFSPINWFDTFVMRLSNVTWQIKNDASPLLQYLWPSSIQERVEVYVILILDYKITWQMKNSDKSSDFYSKGL